MRDQKVASIDAWISLQAQPTGRSAAEQDLRQRSGVDMVARGTMKFSPVRIIAARMALIVGADIYWQQDAGM
jgi:hypothetical protein